MKSSFTKPLLVIAISLAVSFAYAYLRYVVFGSFIPENPFLFISNKSLSLAAVILIPFIISQNSKILKYGINLMVISHILMGLYLLNPGNFPEFFDGSNMMYGFAIMLILAGGISALLFFNIMGKNFIEIPIFWNTLLLILAILTHNILIGLNSWLLWDEWAAWLPPINLLSSLILIFSLGLLVRKRFI